MLAGLRVVSALLAFAVLADAMLIRKDAAPFTLPFVRRMNMTGTAKLLELDQARAKMLKARANGNQGVFQQGAMIQVPATNQIVDYAATVSHLE